MNRTGSVLVTLCLIFLTAGCAVDEDDKGLQLFNYSYDFNESSHDWLFGFSSFSAVTQDSSLYQFEYTYPANLSAVSRYQNALKLSAVSPDGKLFMYIKKKLSGLDPDTEYVVTYEVKLASEAIPVNVQDLSKANAYLKVGAVGLEPQSIISSSRYVLNIDKGEIEESGNDLTNLGSIADQAYVNTIITRSNSYNNAPLKVKTNGNGELWLIVGTDSNFVGKTTVYYTSINVVFSRPK